MKILNVESVGVVCKDLFEFHKWVNNQVKDAYRRYFPITRVEDASRHHDEIIYTTLASANPHYVEIYMKLNNVHVRKRKEGKFA